MKSPIARFALVAAALIQFKDFDGKPAYVQKEVPKLNDDGIPAIEDGQPVLVLVDDLDQPIGVRMVAPGSKEHRAAEDAVAKLARQRAEKMSKKERENSSSPSMFLWLGTEKAARMVTEFVGFDYAGKGASVENTKAFLEDPEWKFLADQVRAATGDDERFLQTASAS
ncbi:hypothetical protein IP91_00125 [Pseudoduganella lurida]|uniref:Uncharacterized protein n=1 Tax=Pseudoduganella lurida TaxID=1036180 RepID=A0A562RKW2_9BURK|nr:hypothetical protein [Pseudoduganella lurida]TWI69060.1 hypothetical protein IP91_00125 [Pseudoduganella lurida]